MAVLPRSLLDELRSQSQVDCDTLDHEVAEVLGPFVDHTSNQAIAYSELQKPKNETIITESIKLAKELHSQYASEVTFEALATEIMMVKLSSRMIPHVTGYAHIQTNPYNAYSESATIANGQRIVALYKHIVPTFPSTRICIKIPSTWEGLAASHALEAQGIATLATTLFSIEQAALAAAAARASTYVAPYVNELAVHFEPGRVDGDKGFGLCRAAARYFARRGARTRVLPASLVSVAEVMRLAGVQHITVAPALLAELAATPAAAAANVGATAAVPWFKEKEVGDEGVVEEEDARLEELVKNEAKWRMAFTRSKAGKAEQKQTSAINIFADMQDGMEGLVRKYAASE